MARRHRADPPISARPARLRNKRRHVGSPARATRHELDDEIGAVATDELVDPGEVSTASGIVGEVMRLFLASIGSIGAQNRRETISGMSFARSRRPSA
jgi:hypothetical protein